MIKWILIALLCIASVGISGDWENPFKGNVKKKSDGVIEGTLVISVAVNTTTKATVYGCPQGIVKKFANGSLIDTLVFVGCPQGSAAWAFSVKDSLDGAAAVSDVITYETNGDTLFVKRQAVTGALGAYTLFRLF